jgi:antagonist of KipI
VTLRVVKPGLCTTVQDLGRPGHGARGVPAGGAADPVSLILANRIVGNPDSLAALEMTLVGPTLAFDGAATVAVAGAAARGVPACTPLDVRAGSTLAFGPLTGGARAYLAVRGGIDVRPVMASRSTLVSAGLGGHDGRALRAGDALPIGAGPLRDPSAPLPAALAALHAHVSRRRLRVVRGPHATALGEHALERLLASEFIVSERSDRVGLRLAGAPLHPARPASAEMITEPMAPGAVQVPPDGDPIVLGPDAPVTGGYPVIASVIAPDLAALGQVAPRDRLHFDLVTVRQGVNEFRALLASLDAAVAPVRH